MAEAVLRRQSATPSAVSGETVEKMSEKTLTKPSQKPDKTSQASKPTQKAPSAGADGKSASSTEKFSAQQDKFQNELLSVLQTINKNQTLQDKRLKQIESKLSEYEEQYDCSYDYTDYEGQQYTGQEDQPVVVSEIEQQNIDIIPNENDPPSIFEGIFKKYNQVDEVDIPVNAHLATLVNKVFREGISDEKFQKLLKDTHRPDNCDSLVKTRVNNLVWNLLSPQIHTIDSNMQKIQEAVIKSAVILTKLLSQNSHVLFETTVEAGTDALGLLGQANKLINVRRKDLHKSNLNPEYHYLCSPSQKYTDMLYGDDISKHVKEIQDVNKIGTRIKGAHFGGGYGYQNRGRGAKNFRGVFRGRVTKPRGRGRGFIPSKSKNQLSEHSKK